MPFPFECLLLFSLLLILDFRRLRGSQADMLLVTYSIICSAE